METTTWTSPAHDRVREHTSTASLRRIDSKTRASVQEAATLSTEAIERRMADLDREWDVDRAVMANFAILGGVSATLAMRDLKRTGRASSGWLVLFGTQVAFLLNHAVRGWCPPLPVFRRLGFRTQKEIDAERQALSNILRDRGHAVRQG
jgi:hypothetical protein